MKKLITALTLVAMSSTVSATEVGGKEFAKTLTNVYAKPVAVKYVETNYAQTIEDAKAIASSVTGNHYVDNDFVKTGAVIASGKISHTLFADDTKSVTLDADYRGRAAMISFNMAWN